VPVTYHIDAAKKLVRTTCSAPVTFAEVIDHFRILREDPACSGNLDVLLDVSGADSLPEASQLGMVNAELGTVCSKVQFGLFAIVAARDAMFGMMRVFEVRASQYFRAIRVFRDTAAAEAWLASQPAPSEPEHSLPT
jgi:hypothetical protein